jgi:crotonobetaine/carnitine-CoA ligase
MPQSASRSSARLPPTDAMHRLVESEPFPSNLGAFLRERAESLGDQTAFTFFEAQAGLADRTLSYRALDARVSRLASALHDRGLRKGDHVGVMLPNCPAWPIAWLAIARLGAVMVPINTRYTARELAYVLSDSDTSWLVIDHALTGLLQELGAARPAPARTITVGGEGGPGLAWDSVLESGRDDFSVTDAPALDDLLTIQYTSGTTGFPKGVMLSHRHWSSFAKIGTTETRHLGITRVFLAHPFYYMAGQAVFLFALHLGATLSIAPQLSIRRFMGWVRETRSEYTLVTNAILKQAMPPEDSVNDLKFLHVSAAYVPAMQEEIERRFGCPVRNIYGMTENGIATYMPLAATHKIGPDCIGIPAPFREVMIADETGRALPDGEVGEICVRGPGILEGYYKKPDANRASYFGDWHRSGDRAYRDADGYFHFLGRMKDVIRRNNENISAVEIETVLLSLSGVERAAAIPVPDDRRGEEVKVYLVLNPGLDATTLPPDAVIAHCAKNLASFKVPRYIEYRTELPTTPSDKIEKQKLRAEKPDLRLGAYDREDGVWR